MPKPYVALTFKIRNQWDQFWANRPGYDREELSDILEEVYPLAESDLEVPIKEGYKAWGHDDYPGLAFYAVDEFNERKFVGIFNRKGGNKARAAAAKVEPTAAQEREVILGYLRWVEETYARSVRAEIKEIASLEHWKWHESMKKIGCENNFKVGKQ